VNVSVERYGAQVEYGRGGAHHVDGGPYVAEFGAEHPVALQVVDQRERHDQRADEQVGDGQRRQEQVADPPQASVRVDGHAHQHVAGDRQEYDDDQKRTCETDGSVCDYVAHMSNIYLNKMTTKRGPETFARQASFRPMAAC